MNKKLVHDIVDSYFDIYEEMLPLIDSYKRYKQIIKQQKVLRIKKNTLGLTYNEIKRLK